MSVQMVRGTVRVWDLHIASGKHVCSFVDCCILDDSYVPSVELSLIMFACCLRLSTHRLDDGTSRMYYTGQGSDGSTAIGVAKLSIPGAEWVREQATILFSTAME